MTQPGETLQYSAADHVKALNDHMEQPFIDTILINNEDIPDEIKSKYAKELARPVEFAKGAIPRSSPRHLIGWSII